MQAHLYVGNLNYSSWSLRGWLCLTWAGVAFDETEIDLDQPGYGGRGVAQARAISPTGRVPALHVDGETIWDTLGIAHYALGGPVGASLLPADPVARQAMWCAVGEMHAGFAPLRRDLSMNLRRRCVAFDLPAETRQDIERIDELWQQLRQRFGRGGPFLFGERTIADAFFAPVATRFRTYGIALSDISSTYVTAVLADAAFLEWERRVLAQPVIPFAGGAIDELYAKK